MCRKKFVNSAKTIFLIYQNFGLVSQICDSPTSQVILRMVALNFVDGCNLLCFSILPKDFSMTRNVLFLLVLVSSKSLGIAADPPKKSFPQQPVDFVRDIQPVLIEKCLSCHGPEMQESGLRVDVRKTLLKGGDSETPAIIPKQSGKSLLMERVTAKDPDNLMPPEGKPLTRTEIALFKRWIDSGAVMPERFEKIQRTTSDHWSFQPIIRPKVPQLPGDWVQTPIDAFVVKKLNQVQLTPASRADRRTLIRRVTFDLTGLPPTPEDIDQFLADTSPQAYERLVDRLLASPAYGERWGRHWLDVVRYADSNGLDENVAHGNAWRYRDYVVNSLNADKPYSQFVKEQLAGDLLPTENQSERNERLVATGVLSLGPKVLAEVDETKMEMDIVDEQIDTFGKAFLGLTLGCARCHDHKFDPVTAEDYYALAGIFKSSKTMDSFKKIAKWHEHEIPTEPQRIRKREYDKKIDGKNGAIAKLIKTANAALLATKDENAKLPAKPEDEYPEATKTQLKNLRAELAALKKEAPVLPTAMGVSEGEVANVPVHQRGSHLSLGKIVPRRYPKVLALPGQPSIPPDASGRLQLANWLTNPDHPLTARVLVNRVWRWHFGRGLVDSTDNFGELGSDPSHPELLDWLAGQLIDSGWTLKKLHRTIVTSNTYCQSSELVHREVIARKARIIDPQNRLLWKANVRRLEAEAIRDSLLAVSGNLDRKMGGSLLNTENRKHVFDHTSKDNTRYDFPCRSVYLPIVRNHLYDLFQLFDYTDASMVNGDRTTSTVAPQALFLMNAEFVQQSADALATRLLETTESDVERIRRLYRLAVGRLPTDAELGRTQSFLARFRQTMNKKDMVELKTWSTLCQVMLVSNEFVTIR